MLLNAGKIALVLGCDCDPLGFAAASREGRREHWKLTVQILERLVTRLNSTIASECTLKVTFLLRSDTYMQEAFGEYAYCARVSYDFLDRLRSTGHEIGWHPHLWRWSGRWLAELKDSQFMKNCLINGFNALREHFDVTSVRTGWDFMTNEFLSLLESLGVQRDFSALPGFRFHEGVLGTSCDWLGTPTGFYFPSRNDYRKPGTPAVKILEMPITITRTPLPIRLVRSMKDRYRKAERSSIQYEPMNIAKHLIFNKNGFESVLCESKAGGVGYVLTYFHPSDITTSGLFSMQNIERNVKYLLGRCKEEKIELCPMTAAEASEDFLNAHHK